MFVYGHPRPACVRRLDIYIYYITSIHQPVSIHKTNLLSTAKLMEKMLCLVLTRLSTWRTRCVVGRRVQLRKRLEDLEKRSISNLNRVDKDGCHSSDATRKYLNVARANLIPNQSCMALYFMADWFGRECLTGHAGSFDKTEGTAGNNVVAKWQTFQSTFPKINPIRDGMNQVVMNFSVLSESLMRSTVLKELRIQKWNFFETADWTRYVVCWCMFVGTKPGCVKHMLRNTTIMDDDHWWKSQFLLNTCFKIGFPRCFCWANFEI